MAATDITKAQIATFFGTDLSAATLYDPTTRSAQGATVDLRGKYFALIGDDGGTPLCVAVGDSYEQMLVYTGLAPGRDVSEGTRAMSIHSVPKGMA